MIDLRSDTVTQPTPAMREAMARADVGDDVFGEDPTTKALEEEVSALTGKESALFVPSGTMGNQLAIACHTRPGDEVIAGEGAHIIWYEAGAAAALSGVQFAMAGRGGLFSADDMIAQLKPASYYTPRTSLVSVENTHNRAGGRIFPQTDADAIGAKARELGLRSHLDGARLWNVSAATGLDLRRLADPFDSVSVCFSKGLGAPIGSALAGSKELVERARRLRKMWGGGMRQSGMIAAAALFAMRHQRARLSEDHANARRLAERLTNKPGLHVDVASVETNIVNIDTDVGAERIAEAVRASGVLIQASGPRRLRAVTHLHIAAGDIDTATDALAFTAARLLDRT